MIAQPGRRGLGQPVRQSAQIVPLGQRIIGESNIGKCLVTAVDPVHASPRSRSHQLCKTFQSGCSRVSTPHQKDLSPRKAVSVCTQHIDHSRVKTRGGFPDCLCFSDCRNVAAADGLGARVHSRGVNDGLSLVNLLPALGPGEKPKRVARAVGVADQILLADTVTPDRDDFHALLDSISQLG